MARVLIFTASYGSGHNAAARSLALALGREGADVSVVDYFRELVGPRFEAWSRMLYYATLRHARTLWGVAYALGDRMGPDSPFGFGMTRLGMERLRQHLVAEAPDAVVSVHATPAVVLSALVAQGRRVPPHTTVVTDFVAHAQWVGPRIDRYCVPATQVGHEFAARGIAPERIVVTGVPLRPEFDAPLSRAGARTALGLSPTRPVVLAMAGSEARLGRLPDVVDVLARIDPGVEAVLVAGRDHDLARRLRRSGAGRTHRILGHVPDIRRWMAAADVLVTKAGGMTVAEAIAAELPMVMYGSLPGQERRNERFATRAGIARIARTRQDLAPTIGDVLGDLGLAEALRTNLRRLQQPGAALRIARAVLERASVPMEEPDTARPR